jgi:hypothetical protein
VTAALALCAALAALALMQIVMVAWYLRALGRRDRVFVPDDRLPPAAIVLCLRGPDPFLSRTLRAIRAQDYPHYAVRIVVDHPQDPAARLVERALAKPAPVPVGVEFLNPADLGGLKCQSLAQVIEELDKSFEVVALVDADVVPHSTWLRDLVAPLMADPRAAVVMGNRWYVPIDTSVGNIVRYIWNACAVVQMYLYRIPWGGSLALRLSFVRNTNLPDRWRHALCEDTMLRTVAAEHGMTVRAAPALLMFNHEGTPLGDCFRWITRQLLVTRLYHPAWPLVLLHAALVTLIPSAAIVLAGCAALREELSVAAWSTVGVAGYVLALFPLLPLLQRWAGAIARERGDTANWFSIGAAVPFLAAALLTAVLYPAAIVQATFMRRVGWRGVQYDVREAYSVRLLEYRPWQASGEQAGTSL